MGTMKNVDDAPVHAVVNRADVFVTVMAYKNGYHLPASELTLNVSHIVSFWDGTVRLNGVDESPVVYLDTVRTSGFVIAGTAAELRSHIQCGELAVFSGTPFQPKQGVSK